MEDKVLRFDTESELENEIYRLQLSIISIVVKETEEFVKKIAEWGYIKAEKKRS